MARNLSLAALGVAALLGAAAPFLPRGAAVEEVTGLGDAEVTAVADGVAATLRETAAGVHARTQTLSDLPATANAVSTDAATVADLDQKELQFRVRPNETIELGQLTGAGKVVSLIRLPRGSPVAPPLDQQGLHVAFIDGKLVLSEVAWVKPSEQGELRTGALGVSWEVDLAPIRQRFAGLAFPARLSFLGRTVVEGERPWPSGAGSVETPLSDSLPGLVLMTPAPARSTSRSFLSPRLGAGIGALVALLVAGALALTGRKAKPAEEAPTAPRPRRTIAIDDGDGDKNLATAGTAVSLEVPAAVTPAPVGPPPRDANQVGRYKLKRLLGSGGMAEVHLARVQGEAGFEKDVALKVMHPALALQPIVVEHFLDEARLASRLVHPNIVQIIDLGRAGDEYFIAMEYVDGSDLEQLLALARARGIPVPARVGLAIIRKICDGLHHAHTASGADGVPLELVHRDVKSANVFVSRKGEVKVGDFGIAKANQVNRINKTELGQVKGTAAFMAPEHRIGQSVDRRADVYGVGAMAYEILTGAEVNLDLAMLAHLGREGWPHLPPPSELRPDLPAELDAIVFRALAYEKNDRYPDCESFESDLEKVCVRHGLLATEKMIAQWVEGELSAQAAAAQAAEAQLAKR